MSYYYQQIQYFIHLKDKLVAMLFFLRSLEFFQKTIKLDKEDKH